MTFEQFKILIIMKTLIAVFSQINSAILECKRDFVRNEAKLNDLFQLVYMTRKQCKIFADVVGASQIAVLFFLFSLTIIVWLMIIQAASVNFPKSLLLLIASIGIIQMGRFGYFTKLVETIQHEVRRNRC
ncbi:unnamed protein product [Orchesella dallaii]|uniref:Uncharacterized protein n=1 Tax=Orchesella dallaii TaxID=48710 RepID=A0ABP1QDD6_9HEXA